MNLVERFLAYAADFELTFVDDDWTRLQPHFTADAVYVTIGPPERQTLGREAILATLHHAVANFDRRCSSRVLATTHGPVAAGNEVSRQWTCIFTCAGAPALRISGSERALYEGDRICRLEEKLTDESRQDFDDWLRAHAAKLTPTSDRKPRA